MKTNKTPFIGEKLYIPTEKFEIYGVIIFGGIATVSKIFNHLSVPFVEFEGIVGHKYSYPHYLSQQKELEEVYKDKIARLEKFEK